MIINPSLSGGVVDLSDYYTKEETNRLISNPNLLDNWYFADPIDQRGGYIQFGGTMMYTDPELTVEFGESSGTTPVVMYSTYARPIDHGVELGLYIKRSDCVRGYTGAGYGIDRWLCDGLVILENGLTLTDQGKYIIQMLDTELKKALDGKTVTVSALLSTGELLFGTKVYSAAPSANEYFVAGALHIVNNTSGGIMFWASQKATISAVKLELGSVQTLAHQDENGNWVLNDPPPNKQQELAKCQRYYWKAVPEDVYWVVPCSDNHCRGSVQLPTTMRVTPAVSYQVFSNGQPTVQIDRASTDTINFSAPNPGDTVYVGVRCIEADANL